MASASGMAVISDWNSVHSVRTAAGAATHDSRTPVKGCSATVRLQPLCVQIVFSLGVCPPKDSQSVYSSTDSRDITQLRLEHARTLLTVSTQEISEIGQIVGLQDHSYYTRLFRERYGLSPMAYRRRLSSH